MINHFLNYEFVYLFLFLFLFFAFIGLLIKNKIIKKISLLFFAIFYSLFFMEFILSFFMPAPTMIYNKGCLYKINDRTTHICRDLKYVDKNGMILRFDGDIFNDLKFTESESCSLVYDKNYTEYYNGFRYTKCNEKSDETYLFFGCSFTFGTAVDDNETLPYYFSEKFNFEKNVINCGVGGQATNTALNILNNDVFENLIPEKSKVKHCFYTLIKDHIYRNFRYEGYCIDSYLYKDNKYTKVKQPYGIFKSLFARCYIFRKVFLPWIDEHNEDFYEDYLLETLKEINGILKEKYNSKLTLIVWPGDPGEYREVFLDKLKKVSLDIIFVPDSFLSYDLGYRVKEDGHPTAQANNIIAEKIYDYLKNIEQD